MKTTIQLLSLLALFAVAAPAISTAADKTPASTESKETKAKAQGFHGTVGAITDKQLTIKYKKGDKNFVIASTTQILDNSESKQPAKLSEVKVGSEVSGSYLKGADGALTLVHLYVAPKVKEPAAKTTDTKTADTKTTTTDSTTTDTPKKKKKKPADTDSSTTTTPPKSNN